MEKTLLRCQKRTVALYTSISGLLLYLGINEEAMFIYFIFLVLDTLTGFIKSWVVHKNTTSKRLIWGIISKLLYLCIPLVVALLFKGLGWEDISGFTISSIISLFLLAEAYSIIQNIYSIKMGKNVLEYDATKAITSFILRTLKSLLEDKTK